MQKFINVLAVASAAVSVAVVGTVGYVYVNREAIIEDVKEKALGSVMGGLGGAGLGGSLGGDLPVGAPDLSPSPAPDQATAPTAPVPPVGGGFGIPN